LTSYLASLPFISTATDAVGKAKLLSMLPAVLSATAFTLMYVAVPNCRVPFKSAVIGGVVIALLFETAKRGFTAFVTQFPSHELIYGAFAAVPLFLLWIFISWVIILMGAELTRSLTVYQTRDRQVKVHHFYIVLGVLQRLWQAQSKGQSVSDRVLLQEVDNLDQGRWDTYLKILLEGGIVKRSDQGEYLLSMDLGVMTLLDLQKLLPWPLPEPEQVSSLVQWQRDFNCMLEQISEAKRNVFNVSIDQLFNASPEPTASEIEQGAQK